MSELFDHAFLERQQASRPHLDVRVYAAAVCEMSQRIPVRNPPGLLVMWLDRADRALRPKLAADAAASAAELERYAVFWVQMLRLVATRGLTPAQIAACIGKARGDGFPKLSPPLVASLLQLGDSWEGATPATTAAAAVPPWIAPHTESHTTRRSENAALHA